MFFNGGHLGSTIFDFLIFPQPLKTAKIDQKGIKTIKEHENVLHLQNLL